MRPVSKKFPVTNPFHRAGDYAAGYHTGIDYGVPVGTPVHTVHAGTVITSGYSSDYGNYIVVRGPRRRKAWLYAHLSKRLVAVGRQVKKGQVIGKSGDTGNSTGPHLHVEQRHSPFGYWDHERPFFA